MSVTLVTALERAMYLRYSLLMSGKLSCNSCKPNVMFL